MGIIAHVGLMKSGTTYIQNTLRKNKDELLKNGILYPGEQFNQQHACYGICGNDIPWVSPRRRWAALGREMLSEIQAYKQNVLISSEGLSSMDESGVNRFCERVGGVDYVVMTVRNFQKTLLSAWQQNIKGGGKSTLIQFLDRLEEQKKKNSGLWRTYAFGEIAERWSRHASVELIVVSENADSSQSFLLSEFNRILGVTLTEPAKISESEKNSSLLFDDVEVLRHINVLHSGLPKVERERMIRRLLKNFFYPSVGKTEGTRIKLPERYWEKSQRWAEEQIQYLPASVTIAGDAMELVKSDSVPVGNLPALSLDKCFSRIVKLIAEEGRR